MQRPPTPDTSDVPAEPANLRRNRDSLRRRAAPKAPPAPPPGAPTLEEAAGQGLRRLRFPEPWESRFLDDCRPARRRLLVACAVVGILGFFIGSINDAPLVPDMAHLFAYTRPAILALMVLSLSVLLLLPARLKRDWHYEAITSFNTLAVSVAILWIGMTTQHVSGFAHTAGIFGLIMYAGIAARQRFRWLLASSLLSVGGYILLVHGHTPLQQLIVHASIKLMLLATGCTLAANYAFEYMDRRVWVLRQRAEAHRAALDVTRQTLNELSMRDPLTGMYNRRQFDAELAHGWAQAQRDGRPVSLLLLDVDFFKPYNDTYGHPAGDACLQTLAKAMTGVAGEWGGLAARLGGEEFAVLLPGVSAQDARQVAERLCETVRGLGIAHRASTVAHHVTVSVGAATLVPDGAAPALTLFERADQSLYRAKHAGRNRVDQDDGRAPTPREQQGTGAMELAQPAVHAPLSGNDSEQEALRQALGPQLRWLRFPAALEARYQAKNAERRRWHLLMASLIGLAVFNLYVYSASAMMPDVAGPLIRMQLAMAPFLMLCMVGICLAPVRPWWREAFYATGAALLAVGCSVWYARSHQLTTLIHVNTLVLVPLFACIAARLPFWFACVPSLVTVATLRMMSAPDEVGRLILLDSVFSVTNGTLYTLIAAYTLEYGARKEWVMSEIGRLQGEALEAAASHLHSLSTLDPLTGMNNRRHFEQRFTKLWDEARVRRQPLSLLILDVDYFKPYNDGYGHAAGDRCLKQLALILQGVAAHEGVVAARLGGEEFAILLSGKGLAEALKMGEAICAAVRCADIEHRFSRLTGHVTVSVGAASMRPDGAMQRSELMARADDALYLAKTQGRDRACAAPVKPQAAA